MSSQKMVQVITGDTPRGREFLMIEVIKINIVVGRRVMMIME
jgi:hypothetical protein